MANDAMFHPATDAWLQEAFGSATPTQLEAWPAIQSGRDVLIAAPTGSGKTLAAFMSALDTLVWEGSKSPLPNQTTVLYVSPLKALSNDIQRNLEMPLQGIRAQLAQRGYDDVVIRTWVRTGDTSQSDRAAARRTPPHIVITTPESLYILLGSDSGRALLSTVRVVIIDEIHAVVGSKRGSHLALSLERLQALSSTPQQRIGLSATQKPLEEVAKFLIGARRKRQQCIIIDSGHVRNRDLQIEVPPSPLEAVMSNDVWQQVYQQLATLINQHRTTLIFVNTRRHAERLARHLSECIGEQYVTAHHGSLSKELRFDAEQRLKAGQLKALVATASLELGIDIGDVNLVCQIGSCRSIASFLQRAGRAGHSVTGTPKARLFPLSRDELVESVALLDAVHRGELDQLIMPQKPMDVLAQQIVAEVATRDWDEDALFDLLTGAYPYRDLQRHEYNDILQLLAEGYGTRRGSSRQYIHRDAVQKMLRGRRGARLTALTSGGTIPDNADYNVVLEPEGITVGTVNEDFAVESLANDIFQLGNTAYRIIRVEAGRVRVEDAKGQPPTIPFWLGEAPGRSAELSYAVARLFSDFEKHPHRDDYLRYLQNEVHLAPAAASQLVDYISVAKIALGALPTQDTIIFERFFDESGGMQLVIHTPFGSRINRAWGLALRKRFCRKFDFELQAAATEDAIILSLSTSHSFPLEEVAHYLNSRSVRDVLIQAMLDAPMFAARWRWNASISLAIPRFRGSRKVPPQLQRMYAEDLIADIFPDQIACAENLTGPREIPDHPLVQQTIDDCLHEAMDIDGLIRILEKIETGKIRIVAKDVTEPSPLALQILAARPYAFLDDAPLEERRTQAVMSRRWLDPENASDLGALDIAAIERVRAEAFPDATNIDELHDALMCCNFFTDKELGAQPGWEQLFSQLLKSKRATCLVVDNKSLCIATERVPRFQAVFPDKQCSPKVKVPESCLSPDLTYENAVVEILRGRLEILGPITSAALALPLGISSSHAEVALLALQQEGYVLRGQFTPGSTEIEWCERGLLSRIHRYTLNRLRQEIEPVTTQDFMRFLFQWQHIAATTRKEGPEALVGILANLEGFEAAAIAWESEILPARLKDYDFSWLDDLCLAGRAGWARLAKPKTDETNKRVGPVRTTPIALVTRRNMPIWNAAASSSQLSNPVMSSKAERVHGFLSQHGASFFDEIVDGERMLATEVEAALAELVALGLVNSDSFAGIRALLIPLDKRKSFSNTKRRHRTAAFGIQDAGRWSILRNQNKAESGIDSAALESIARALLRRYGVIFWRLLAREADWLPPWRDLLRVFRRLEARGEIRGGRFVSGISGEQFALPDALSALRAIRREPYTKELIVVSGADPLNVIGLLVPGPKVPALAGNRILFRDGVAIATLIADEIEWQQQLDIHEKQQAKQTLILRLPGAPQLATLRAKAYREKH